MKKTFKMAFIDTIPVLTGYLVLGFGFGIMLKSAGYSILLAFIMSITMYAGSMQYIAVSLFTSGASYLTTFLTTIMVQARHLFYGISLLDKYRHTGKRKPYLIFALTDETYSLACMEHPYVSPENLSNYYFFVSILDHCYWILGCVIGATVGALFKFNTQGIDFVLTALFVTIFLEQWLSTKKHAPAIIGVCVSIACLLLFGSESFLIPAMIVIAITLCLMKGDKENA